MTMQMLQQGGWSQQRNQPENFWEKSQFFWGVFIAVIAATVYFFVTVMALKEELSSIKTSLSVLQSEQTHLKANLERIDKNTEKQEKTSERLVEISADIAVLKARKSER